MRRNRLGALALPCRTAMIAPAAAETRQPDVLVIHCDQFHHDGVGEADSSTIITGSCANTDESM